jgi:ketosteroid isomerase-like protein
MSQENVEIVRRLIAAVQRGGADRLAALDAYDAAVQLDQTRMPAGGMYHGREGVRAFYDEWFGAWDELTIQIERFIDAGDDDVLVVVRMTGRGRATGVSVAIRSADVYTVRDGKVVRQVGYPDAAEAFKAVGLAE